MLDNLTNRLARVMKTLKGEARLTETNIADALREVRMALLEADVALPVVKDFIAAVKEKCIPASEKRSSCRPKAWISRLMAMAPRSHASIGLATDWCSLSRQRVFQKWKPSPA